MALSPQKKHLASTNSRIPAPQSHRVSDPWNSASTGHQRAENTLSGATSWRATRAAKLKQQFQNRGSSSSSASRSTTALDDRDFAPQPFDGTCGSVSLVAERDVGAGRAGEWRCVSEEEARRAQMGVQDIRYFMNVGKRKADGDLRMHTRGMKKAKIIPIKIESPKEGERVVDKKEETAAITQTLPSESSTTTTTVPSTRISNEERVAVSNIFC